MEHMNGNPEQAARTAQVDGEFKRRDSYHEAGLEESKDAANGHRSRSPSNHSRRRWEDDEDRSRSRSRSGRYGDRKQRDGSHHSDGQQPEPVDGGDYTQVYVGGITRGCTADDLKKHFDNFGPIHDIVMKGRYAFIDFAMPEDARAAVKEMN